MKSPTNQYISFVLQQEVVRKPTLHHPPHTAPVAARNAPVWARSHRIGVVLVQPNAALKSPLSGDFLFYRKGIYLNWISLYREILHK